MSREARKRQRKKRRAEAQEVAELEQMSVVKTALRLADLEATVAKLLDAAAMQGGELITARREVTRLTAKVAEQFQQLVDCDVKILNKDTQIGALVNRIQELERDFRSSERDLRASELKNRMLAQRNASLSSDLAHARRTQRAPPAAPPSDLFKNKKEWKDLVSLVHPDKFSEGSPQHEKATEFTRRLIEARPQ